MTRCRFPFRSRAAIVCIVIVVLIVSVAVISRLHPTASSSPHVATEAAALRFKYGASTEVKSLPGHVAAIPQRTAGSPGVVHAAAGTESHKAAAGGSVMEQVHKHHSVSDAAFHDAYAHHKHVSRHGGAHPNDHAVPRHAGHHASPASKRHARRQAHRAGKAGAHGAEHHAVTLAHAGGAASGVNASLALPHAQLVERLGLQHGSKAAAAGANSRFKRLDALAKSAAAAAAGVAAKPSAAAPTHAPAAHGPLPAYLRDTAIVTMATGDGHARLAIALVQSLRDVGTRVPHIVVLVSRGGVGSKDCQDYAWKKAHGRVEVDCSGPHTIAPEIISQPYIDVLQALGAEVRVIDPIPETPFTKAIPGGRSVFWGMAFNKLRVFNMTEYRKLLWMDADTLALKNIDHLMKEPMFTAAFTFDCCNQNAPAKPSGGLWVVEPSIEVAGQLQALIDGPVPGTGGEGWHWGDMQVVRYLFGMPPNPKDVEPLWPSVEDARHGYVPGVKEFPETQQMAPATWAALVERMPPEHRVAEGLLPSAWDGKHPKYVWRSLDATYDQCIGNCECLPGRDMPKKAKTVHFSCIQHLQKPSHYESEHEFFSALRTYALSCTRFWFSLWEEKYRKAAGRLPAPLWSGPEVPLFDHLHDELVLHNRLKAGV